MSWVTSRGLFGRAAEQATVAELLIRARIDGGAVLIAGDPGMGKSRLAEEAAAHATDAGFLVAWGRCRESEGAPPLWPWTQVLRQLHCAPLTPDAADVAGRFRFFEQVTDQLREASVAAAVLIVLDDFHRADELSSRLLGFVTDQLWPARVGFLVTFRDAEVAAGTGSRVLHRLAAAGRARSIRLPGLDVDAVAGWLDSEGLNDSADQVHDRTGGNPLYVFETIRLIRSGRGDQIPPSAVELMGVLVGAMPASTRTVLGTAAVFGRDFGYAPLAAAVGMAPASVVDVLLPAVRAGVVIRDQARPGGYRFVHALVREAVLGAIGESGRAELHAAALVALRSTGAGQPSDLAHHAVQARVVIGDHAAATLTTAAAAAAEQHMAWEDSARWWEVTADLIAAQDMSANRAVRMRWGLSLLRSGEVARARSCFEEVAASAQLDGDAELLAEAALAVGETVAEVAADRALIRVLDLALAGSGVAPSVQVKLESRRAMAAYWLPHGRTDARRRSAAAVSHARQIGDDQALGVAMVARQFTLRSPGHLSERIAVGEAASQLADRLGDDELRFRVHQWLIPDRFQAGDLRGVRAELAAAAAIAEARQDPLERWWVTIFEGLLAGFEGQDVAAEQYAREAGERGRRLQQPAADVYEAGQLVPLYWRAGRLSELEADLTRLVPQFPGLPTLECDLLLVFAATGQVAAARRGLRRLMADDFAAFRRDSLYLASLAVLGECSVTIGDVESARVLLTALAPYATRNIIQGAPVGWGSGAWHLARLAELVGDGTSAIRYEATAHRLHEQWGAGPVGPPREKWIAVLSPREHAVLRLLTAGRSNREIAAALTISVHTAERHVANIFGKLGTRNRAEATAWGLHHGIGQSAT